MTDRADTATRTRGTTRSNGKSVLRATGSPAGILAITALLTVAILSLPVRLPIGAMYWDLVVYLDGANRIHSGQVPTVDFFAPVGPLGYYLFAGGSAIFGNAQPLLLVQWSLLVVTAPLMALALIELDRRSRATAIAVLVPFLIFSLLPFNTRSYYPFPGSDGFGIYNRQVCQLLYVLTVALLFTRSRVLLGSVIAAAMLALFLTKITGLIAGLMLCAFALAAGRVSFTVAAGSAIAFGAILGLIELSTGFVSGYFADILALVQMNSESLAPRFLQAASHTFGIVMPAGMLAILLLYSERRKLSAALKDFVRRPMPAPLAKLLDRPAFWILATVVAGIFFETQNTGSQALIFLWPVVVWGLMRSFNDLMRTPAILGGCVLLAAAASLPPIVNTSEHAARTFAGAAKNVPLVHDNLGTLGQVNARPEVMNRALKMMTFYPRNRQTYEDFVAIDELPEFIFYSAPDYQLDHLLAIDQAVASILALEAQNGVRFETMMNINFVNPFPWLLDRTATRHIAIGADPSRAVPAPGPEAMAAIGDTDLALLPTCPPTTANRQLLNLYEAALRSHRRIRLDSCFDAYIHPRFGPIGG